jgi:hypothetical protein
MAMTPQKAAYQRAYREANRETLRLQAKLRYHSKRKEILEKQRASNRSDRRRLMLINSKTRAIRKGLEHTLSLDDIRIPNKCPLLGIELRSGNGCACDSSPSLDRIDPEKGYTPENTWVISNRANRIKSDATPHELIAIGRALAAKIADGL